MQRNVMNKRVLNDLKKRSSIGILVYVILAFLIVSSNGYYQRNPVFSLVFFCLVCGISIIRVIHLSLFSFLENRSESLNRAVFVFLVLATSTIWGMCFAYSMCQSDEHTSKMLVAICTAGLTAGGVVAFIPHRNLSVVFNLLMLMPASVQMAIRCINPGLSTMIVLFSIYLLLLTIRGSREYWTALENEMKLEEQAVELKRLSHTDPLTCLYNRRYFNEIFDFEWKRSSRDKTSLTVVICDIDYFKKINDTYGHMAGDEYLVNVARLLRNKFKRDTDIVARFGGEEFIILLSGLDDAKAFQMADVLRKEVMECKVVFENKEIRTTLSFGIASCVPDLQSQPEHLITRADMALYRAKELGRNRVEIDTTPQEL